MNYYLHSNHHLKTICTLLLFFIKKINSNILECERLKILESIKKNIFI